MKRWELLVLVFIFTFIFYGINVIVKPPCEQKIINVTEKDFNFNSIPPMYKIITNETTYNANINVLQNLKIGLNSCYICGKEIIR